MATLKDIAKDAGVSIATVSCCLSGSRTVKPETKMRIMDSIERLKYIPNASARNLKKNASDRIGVILTDIDNAYHAEIFKGISACMQRKGYTISVAFSHDSASIECGIIEEFISQNVSGLLIITSMPQNTDFFVNRIQNYNIPTVFIDRRPHNIDASFVGFDNAAATYHLTKSLLDCRYRRIALVTGSPDYSSESDCIKGYKTAFAGNNIPCTDSLIQVCNMSKEDAFKTVLSNLDLDTLEAVIATSENIAHGLLECFHVQNISVPKDIRLLTFSEECWNHSARLPGVLHTSRTAFPLGAAAADLLIQKIKSPVIFEEKSIFFKDDIVKEPLTFPAPAQKIPFPMPSDRTQEALRILMVDLATSHSAKLLSKNFTEKTGIPVEIDLLPQDRLLDEIIRDMEMPTHKYDIYMYDVPWLSYMVQNGLVSDISDYVAGEHFPADSVFEQNLENCFYDGHYYGIPIISGSQIMFYRKDLFENHTIARKFKNRYQISLRPPKTWAEFNGTAEYFTRSINPDSPTLYGTSVAGIVDEELAPEILIRLWASGGSLWDSYKRATLNTPENARAFSSLLQTMQYTEKSPFETSIFQTVEDFSSGKTAMLVTYTEYAAKIRKSIDQNIIGQVGYDTLPGRTPVSIGWNLGISPYSTRAESAYRYFGWLCQNDTSYYMTIMDGQSPVMAPYHSHELLKLYPWLELTEQSFSYCRKRVGPYRPKSLVIPQNKTEAILCKVVKDVLKEGIPLTQSLETRQAQLEALFKSYGYPKPLHFI